MQIAYFMEHNFDLLSLVQTPHHSWKNPAERVMPNLNLGLQGVGVMRAETSMELQLKSTSSLKAVRHLAKKVPGLQLEVEDSIQPAKIVISDVFSRLQLKDKNFNIFHAATKKDMLKLGEQLTKLDESFVYSKPCPRKRSSPWQYGQVTSKPASRSYVISTSKGSVRRNRVQIRPANPGNLQITGNQSTASGVSRQAQVISRELTSFSTEFNPRVLSLIFPVKDLVRVHFTKQDLEE